jgi:hypothetical protein
MILPGSAVQVKGLASARLPQEWSRILSLLVALIVGKTLPPGLDRARARDLDSDKPINSHMANDFVSRTHLDSALFVLFSPKMGGFRTWLFIRQLLH